MNPDVRREHERRVLLAAPTRRDAEVTLSLLEKAGLFCIVCDGLRGLAGEIDSGAGVILLTEEAMTAPGIGELLDALATQPPWSDLAVVLLLRGGVLSPAASKVLRSAPQCDAFRTAGADTLCGKRCASCPSRTRSAVPDSRSNRIDPPRRSNFQRASTAIGNCRRRVRTRHVSLRNAAGSDCVE